MASKNTGAQMSYKAAMQRVNEIIDAISGDQVDVDDLSKHVKEAAQLLTQCREKLLAADAVVKESLAGLQAAAPAAPGPPVQRRAAAHVFQSADDDTDPFAEG